MLATLAFISLSVGCASAETGIDKASFRDNSYLVVTEKMTWSEAKLHAESLGSHLVTISDEAENIFVVDLAREKSVSRSFWIGLTLVLRQTEQRRRQ